MQVMVKGTTITRIKEPHFTFSQQNHIISGYYEDQIATNFIHCFYLTSDVIKHVNFHLPSLETPAEFSVVIILNIPVNLLT